MRKDIDVVAFDLDGTLYPNIEFYSRLIPFVLKEHRLLIALGKARDMLRSREYKGNFYDMQAQLIAEMLKRDPALIQNSIAPFSHSLISLFTIISLFNLLCAILCVTS